MRRRTVMAGVAALAVPGAVRAQAPEILPIWPGTPPGPGTGPGGTGVREDDGRNGVVVDRVAQPSLQVIRPARPNGSAMLVAAGGGYRRIETGMESIPGAEWLASQGTTAFVLRYRLPDEGWSPMAPVQDAARAMRVIRRQPGIDGNRVGVLGFSAGGHLVGLMAAMAERSLYAPVDALDSAPARPDMVALLYPVITLLPPYDQTSTRKQLAGSDPALEAQFSVERQVTHAMPPVFLAQSVNDPISPFQNSLLMRDACHAAGVPVELHLFQTGRHGWGMGHGETAQWPGLLSQWLAVQRFWTS